MPSSSPAPSARSNRGHALDGGGGFRRWLLSGRLRPDRAGLPTLAVIFLFATVIRLWPVLLSGGLKGLIHYDDGVYFGAAVATLMGRLPYRDFLLLHPPGIILVLGPFAALGRIIGDADAFALARVGFMVLGGLNAVLAALVAGRYMRVAGILAGLLYAVWATATLVEHNTNLHVPQSALLLLALYALARPGRLRPRRAAVVGALIGVAMAIQLWQGVTLLVLLWWVTVRGPRPWSSKAVTGLAFGSAALAAFAAICLPFLAVAPVALVRDVLTDQLGRPDIGVGTIERIRAIEGLPQTTQLSGLMRALVPEPLVLIVAAILLVILVVVARRFGWTRPWVVLALAQVGVVLVTPSFFNDYPAFAAPAATLVLGTGLGAWVRGRFGRRPSAEARGLIIVGILAALAFVSVARQESLRLPLAALDRDVRQVRCVSADFPSVLILTSALSRDIAAGCAVVLDPTGSSFETDRGRLAQGPPTMARLRAPGYQLAMRGWYAGSDLALLIHPDDLAPQTMSAIQGALPHQRQVGIIMVLGALP